MSLEGPLCDQEYLFMFLLIIDMEYPVGTSSENVPLYWCSRRTRAGQQQRQNLNIDATKF